MLSGDVVSRVLQEAGVGVRLQVGVDGVVDCPVEREAVL